MEHWFWPDSKMEESTSETQGWKGKYGKTTPSSHMAFIQRRLNIDATSWRCIDVEATFYKRHVPAGPAYHR